MITNELHAVQCIKITNEIKNSLFKSYTNGKYINQPQYSKIILWKSLLKSGGNMAIIIAQVQEVFYIYLQYVFSMFAIRHSLHNSISIGGSAGISK